MLVNVGRIQITIRYVELHFKGSQCKNSCSSNYSVSKRDMRDNQTEIRSTKQSPTSGHCPFLDEHKKSVVLNLLEFKDGSSVDILY